MQKVKVIGGGLAGAECANYLATHGVKVELYDIKPLKKTPAHLSDNYAELVCSNSLKSNDVYGNAAGLLKEEMRRLGSLTMEIADITKVPAGGALAVDREKFSSLITARLKENPNIEHITEEVTDIDTKNGFTVIATGPLTTEKLSENISKLVGGGLAFYDASAPIVDFESIDMSSAFFGDRYDKGNGDHINCPMNKDEYLAFMDALRTAERAELHGFEKKAVFEGCMPIEVMAERGVDTLRFGPLKPVGLTDPKTGRWAYACLQLRKEDDKGTMYNLVGFQTNLLWGEQKRVFSLIPALKNAEYHRYGVMHRNTFINAPKVLNKDYSLKEFPNVFFAGQITGVEGYVESSASGLMVGIYCLKKLQGNEIKPVSEYTVLGALAKFITTANTDFQPMNANFGILPSLNVMIRDKAERKRQMAERSLKEISDFIKEI
ncbi:MAG: methylenetetrahydrofolate--tRNA-(uracil(54)-C(5))-methyltransferase (FADH(2)-oxidizing) TrmFO [Clostridia bacterium]|nr:methylenetetrahydrofolate--tRNA-(uracil(54)-C(5))-methyltransferase (FADH(2)-oxidizing) TrmFO [Clostridia bacterium]